VLSLILVAYLYFRSYRPSPVPINSVAVLPFAVDNSIQLSDETRVLMAWMSDSVANSLQELPSLKKVIAPSSLLGSNTEDKTPQAIGQRYGVQAVLIGRVLQLGDEISIQISLIDTNDSRLINGSSYVFEKRKSTTIKGDISSRITEDL